jgi:hypothetical protein
LLLISKGTESTSCLTDIPLLDKFFVGDTMRSGTKCDFPAKRKGFWWERYETTLLNCMCYSLNLEGRGWGCLGGSETEGLLVGVISPADVKGLWVEEKQENSLELHVLLVGHVKGKSDAASLGSP